MWGPRRPPRGTPGRTLPPRGPAQSQQPCLVLRALPLRSLCPSGLHRPRHLLGPVRGRGPGPSHGELRHRRRALPTTLLGPSGAGLRAHAQRPYGSGKEEVLPGFSGRRRRRRRLRGQRWHHVPAVTRSRPRCAGGGGGGRTPR